MVQKYYPGEGESDRVNAFRHFIWQASLTITVGRQDAELIADAHEACSPSDTQPDHISDLVNNEYARKKGEEIAKANPLGGWRALQDTVPE